MVLVWCALMAGTLFAVPATTTRDLPNNYPSSPTEITVTIQLSVDEGSLPSGVIINEYLPAGWTFVSGSASPVQSDWNASTRELKWLFTAVVGRPPADTTITYKASYSAGESGEKTFSGNVNYNPGNVQAATAGDTTISDAASAPDGTKCTVEATTPVVADGVAASTITITAKNAAGNAIVGIPAALVVVSATGTDNVLTQPTNATDAQGRTTATLKSTTVGTKTVSVEIKGVDVADTAQVVFTVGSVSAGQSTVDATTPVNVNAGSTVTITARDAAGRPIPGIPPAEIVVQATLPCTITGPSQATNASGQTTASIVWSTAGIKTVSVTIDGEAITDTAQVAVQGTPYLVFSAQPAGPYSAGAEINAIPQVTVKNGLGETDTLFTGNVTVALGQNPASGTLSGTKTRAATAGVVSFPGLSINKASTSNYTLAATAVGINGSVESSGFRITPASPASLRFVVSPAPTGNVATTTLTPHPQVELLDQFGNRATAATDAVNVVLAGAGTLVDSTTLVNAAVGVATFGNLKVGAPGTFPGQFHLTATSGALTPADSAEFEVTAPPVLRIAKAGPDTAVDPNATVDYTITYENIGLGNATDTVIIETLPEHVVVNQASITDGGVYNATARTITWTIGPLAAGGQGTVGFAVTLDSSLADGGTVTNATLTIDCDETESVPAAAEITTVRDKQGPTVTPIFPAANATGVPVRTMVKLQMMDRSGVDLDTARIRIAGDLVYEGGQATYDSTAAANSRIKGICTRTGTSTYVFRFQFSATVQFANQETVQVVVEAADENGNETSFPYSFTTSVRNFSKNSRVNSTAGGLTLDNPATARDAEGDIWVVWDQTAAAGQTDIYAGRLPFGASTFQASAPIVAADRSNKSNPAVAVDPNSVAHAVWQQQGANGRWDIYLSSFRPGGASWSQPVKVNVGDPNNTSDQKLPAMAAGGTNASPIYYVVWEDYRAAQSQIWMATSTNQGGTWTERQITDQSAVDAREPGVAVDPNGTVFVVWTDARNAGTTGTDLYGASSDDNVPWTNRRLVSAAGNQFGPAGAAAADMHLAWVSGTGGQGDIQYANDRGDVFPFTGTSIIDDGEPDTVHRMPTVAARAVNNSDRVYASWEDGRDVTVENPRDTDIYFAESGSPFGVNLLVNDDRGNNTQTKPAIGIDKAGDPYLVWVDDRGGSNDIYFAGTIALEPPLDNTVVPDPNGAATVRLPAQTNLGVRIPAGALPAGIDANDISVSEVRPLPGMLPPQGGFGAYYDFGPGGIPPFSQPVTIKIPLAADAPVRNPYKVYFYDLDQGAWTEDGIHNPAKKVNGAGGAYLVVDVDHFSIFGVGGVVPGQSAQGGDDTIWGGDDGGGCALAPWSCGNPIEYSLPFAAYVLVLGAISCVDRLRRRSGLGGR
ncbi:MAG: Ig-like domain-containing protein [Planctomycetes bacterium]|nr:Ig-like domain-containing protein [Planctomycetota bacterium]